MPGPRIGQAIMLATQAIDNAAVVYWRALEEFLLATGLNEKHARAPTVVPTDQTGHEVSQRHFNQLALYEAKALELTRSLAVSELAMHNFGIVIDSLVHHHAQLRTRFEQLGSRARLTIRHME